MTVPHWHRAYDGPTKTPPAGRELNAWELRTESLRLLVHRLEFNPGLWFLTCSELHIHGDSLGDIPELEAMELAEMRVWALLSGLTLEVDEIIHARHLPVPTGA